MEVSYSELRAKEVVNVLDGARMGRIVDVIFDANARNVIGLVVPGIRKLFRAAEDIFIPWKNICKIGSDVILVSLEVASATNVVRTDECGNNDCGCKTEDYL